MLNAIEQMFRQIQTPDGTICQLDCRTLVRAIGMNPTEASFAEILAALGIRDEAREAAERAARDERIRKEVERQLREAQAGGAPKARERVSDMRKRKGAASATGGSGKQMDAEKVSKWIPPERRAVVTFDLFARALAPLYRDVVTEEAEVLAALRVFDPAGTGSLGRDALIHILTSMGDDPLTPTEVRALTEIFPGPTVEFSAFCAAVKAAPFPFAGTALPTLPPSAAVAPA